MPVVSANLRENHYEYAEGALARIAPTLPSRALFDIGPGDGRMRRLARLGFTWTGFDREGWADVCAWDLAEPCPAGKNVAGAALLLEVVEHLPNPLVGLRHIADALQDGGVLILTTPNARWSASRVTMLFRGVPGGFSARDLKENHHVFFPLPHVLERFLAEAGFCIEEYVTLNGWTTPLRNDGTLFFPARFLLNLILMVIERLDPTSRGMGIGLIARKVPGGTTVLPYSVAPEGGG